MAASPPGATSPRRHVAPDADRLAPAPSSRTLVIQTAFLGDVVLTLPLLMGLAREYGPVDVLTTPAAASLLQHHPAVRQVIPFDKRGRDRGPVGLLRMGRRLRAERYARAYLPHGSLRSAALALLSGASARIGFVGAAGSLSYTARHPRPEGHESARLQSLQAGATEPIPPAPWLALTDAARDEASGWLGARGVPERFVVLAPGSRWGSKRWPYYAELAAALEVGLVVVGSGEDREAGEQIVAAAPGHGWNAAGELSLMGSAALVARAALVVSNDSVPLHLATALGRPVVALFGPTIPAFGFGPVWPNGTVVEQFGLPCRPCSHHGPPACPLGHHRCMREIGAERVAEVVRASGLVGE